MARVQKRAPAKKKTGFALWAKNPSTARAEHARARVQAKAERAARRTRDARRRHAGTLPVDGLQRRRNAVLDEREKALLEQLHAQGLSVRETAAAVRCSDSTVRRALTAHLRGPPKQLGRPRTLSFEDHVALCNAFDDDPYAGVAAVLAVLRDRGLELSLDTVRREMKRAVKAIKKRAVNR
jgi:transposase